MASAPVAFISHASEDAEAAHELVVHLEADGVPCWIAPRDVTPGRNYAAEIVAGIEACTAFVLVLSHAANGSPFVVREVERAASKGKPIFTVRIDDVAPEPAIAFFVSSSHWIDAFAQPRDREWAQIARALRGEREGPGDAYGTSARRVAAARSTRRRRIAWAIAAAAALLAMPLLLLREPVAPPPTPDSPVDASPPPVERVPQESPAAEAPPAAGAPVSPERAPPAHQPPASADGAAAAAAHIGPCPQSYSAIPGLAAAFACDCDANATRGGTVWGTDRYTDDSALCRAALHAGAIPASGGTVTVLREPGRDLYVGSLRHGVRSSDHGARRDSIRFAGTVVTEGPERCPERFSVNPDLATPFTCLCGASDTRAGTVWGSDLYTSDSSLCRAAQHAGVITAKGGPITIEREPGRDLYAGTRRHGVLTSDYGAYPESIRFEGASPPPETDPCPAHLSVNPNLETPYTCTCLPEAVLSGVVWGSGPYTADSALCRAALHAGKLTRAGGTVTVDYVDGSDRYAGSQRNGVASSDYGSYPRGIAFR